MLFKNYRRAVQNNLRTHLPFLRWFVPLLLTVLVVLYEFGPARWLYEQQGLLYNTIADLLVFGTIGPLFALVTLYFLERWLDERDTTEFQAHVLNQVREEIKDGRQLHDDSIQVLFAASLLLDSFKANHPELPPDTAVQIGKTETALNQAILQLREHLTNQEKQKL